MKIRKITFLLLTLICGLTLSAQSPVGIWKTIDDNTDKARSHVEIYETDGAYHGKLVKLLTADPESVCDKCPGNKKDKPLLGLVIIENLKKVKDYWGKGEILDPESGKEYGCSVWFEDGDTDVLKVRGKHWTGLYRTQTWYRVK